MDLKMVMNSSKVVCPPSSIPIRAGLELCQCKGMPHMVKSIYQILIWLKIHAKVMQPGLHRDHV
jgi:hypothetical protein